jgi:hypothetical protein
MKDAVNLGMSIMDNYFDKIDPKKSRAGDDDDENDADEQADSDDENLKNQGDLIIYESKDPYVLHNLPFVIGSNLYLESDHIGLKDMESDEEAKPGDDDNDEDDDDDDDSDDDESVANQQTGKHAKSDSDESTDDSDDDDFKALSKPTPKKQNVFAESDDDDDDGGLFKPDKKDVRKLSI